MIKFNKDSVKQSYVDKAINSSAEYKSLQAANSNLDLTKNSSAEKQTLDQLNATGAQLSTTQTQQQGTLDSAKADVQKAQSDYLDAVKTADAAARDQMVSAISALIASDSDAINQTEYDKALYKWAEDPNFTKIVVFWTPEYKDAAKLREYMNDTYNETYWRGVFDHLGITQWTVNTKKVNEVMSNVILTYRSDLRKAEEKKANTIAAIAQSDALSAKGTAATAQSSAQTARNMAASAVTTADSAALSAAASKASAQTAASTAESIAKTAQDTFAAKATLTGTDGRTYTQVLADAQDKVTDAKSQLADIKKDAATYSQLSAIDLTKLFNAIADAEKAVKTAESTVAQVKALTEKTEAYSGFANAYAGYVDGEAQTTSAFARVNRDADGNIIYPAVNDMDLTDTTVKSQNTNKFINVSESSAVEVPENIFKAYLEAISKYEHGDKSGINYEVKGSGISTGGSMPIVYWAVDANGNVTGNYYTSTTQLSPSTKYFVGYTFKHENDGYHMDGIYLTTAAAQPVPQTETTTTTTTSTVTTTTAATTIAEAATPLAATPAVLGARRTPSVATAETAAIAQTPAVLGAARSRATGDSTHNDLRLIVTLAGAAGAAGLFAAEKRKKAQKKEQ